MAFVAVVITLSGGCSLIVNRASVECTTSGDCAHFANGSACEQGVCVAPAVTPDAAPEGAPRPDVSIPPITSCQTTQDCLPEHSGANWICRKSDGTCVSVVSPDCPGPIIGQYTSDDVVLLGALLPLASNGTYGRLGRAIADSIRLGAEDFSGGLPPLTDAGNRRPIAVIICDETDNVDRAATHLVVDLNVPVILGTVFSSTTLEVATKVTLPAKKPPLLISPAAGSDLFAVADGGLVWRTAPSDTYQAAAITAMLGYLGKTGPADGGPALRIAIVRQADVYGTQIGSQVTANLKLDGGAGASIDVDYGDPDHPQPNQNQKYADAISAVTTPGSLPDVIVLIGYTHAIASVLSGIESTWPNAPRPQYLLSNGLETADLTAYIATNTTNVRTRILGTAPGGNPADSVTRAFDVRYRQTFTGATDHSFPESYAAANAYDAFFVVAYGISATRNFDLVGLDVTTAARKVLKLSPSDASVPIAVGSNAIATAFAAIQAGKPIVLQGVSGPLGDFTTGDVVSDIQVWCVVQQGSAAPAVETSGLAYDVTASKLKGTLDTACTL